MLRMLFEKTGNGIWISHLDLMRVFQRAFRRAGLTVRHTQGYNPHAFVSIVLPLSVGTESCCELLEFELDTPDVNLEELPERMNAVLPDGIRCLHAYEGGKKIKELVYLRTSVTLEYDCGVPMDAEDAIGRLFAQKTLPVEKRTKSGMAEVDIRPMIHSLQISVPNTQCVELHAVICAQNPSLNPDLLAKAVAVYLPQFEADFAKSARLEVLTGELEPFR